MRAKWPLLLKIQLMGLTGINKAKKSGDPRAKRKAAGGAAALAVVGALILFYVAVLAIAFCQQGIGNHLPALIVALSSVIIFAFTLFQGCSMLFATKDYDMVMSLPIPKREIILARLLCAYLVNLAFTLAVAIPATIVLFVFEGFSFAVLGVILLAVLTAPLLPLAVAAALGTAITALTAGMRFKNLLQSILGIALFVGVMLLSFSFSFGAGSGGADMGELFRMLAGKIYPPALLVDMTLTGGAVWGVFVFAGISVAAAALFVLIVGRFYTKINTALFNRGARVAYRAKDIKSSSAFAALVKREFKRLFSCSGYLLNGASGTLLLLIFGIALLFINIETLFQIPAEEFDSVKNLIVPMGAGFMILFIGMSCPSASALSMEGKSRGQLFSLPLSTRQILLAKAVPTFLLDCAAGIVFGIIFCAKLGAGAAGWAVILLIAPLFSAFIALFGIFLNYKFPKYDWTTETQVAKNSVPVLIVVLGSMIIGLAVIILSAFAGIWLAIAVNALCVLLIILLFALLSRAKLYV